MSAMRWRVAVGAIGVACMAYGLVAMVRGGVVTSYVQAARDMIGLVVLHDIVFAPVVALVGWLLVRALPPRPRAFVQGGLFVAVCAVVVAVPVLTGRGGHGNPTVDPLDYRRNILLVLAAVAIGTAALGMLAGVRSRRR